jgi:hypothetical protein
MDDRELLEIIETRAWIPKKKANETKPKLESTAQVSG